jgi:hypothetical protein
LAKVKKRNFDPERSFVKKLQESGKVNESTLQFIHNLTIEELLSVKIELAAKAVGRCYYGFSIWQSIFSIVESAIYKSATRLCTSRKEIREFLGVSERQLDNLETRMREQTDDQ